jgi:chromosome partitioning protein
MLDFASSAQFWRMYLEFAEPIKRLKGVEKLFNFINVLMTRVDNQEAMSSDVRRWIMSAYGDSVLPIEIPKTSTASTASAEFGTAYDLSDAMANSRTWKRAHDAYERFVDLMEEQVIGIWANQTQDSSGAPNAAITKI